MMMEEQKLIEKQRRPRVSRQVGSGRRRQRDERRALSNSLQFASGGVGPFVPRRARGNLDEGGFRDQPMPPTSIQSGRQTTGFTEKDESRPAVKV
jgi:hypothetical protein